jgi:hypothetical protein
MPKAKKKGVMYKGKRVYGAVATRIKRKRAAAKRRSTTAKRRRKNPVRSPRSRGMVLSEKEFQRRVAAEMRKRKAAAKKRKKPAKKRTHPKKAKVTVTRAKPKKAAAKKRRKTVAKKRKTTKRKTTKRKSPKRVAAAKKAARTRARKKAARKRAGRKAAAARARRRRVPRRGYVRTRRRKAIKRYGRGVRSMARARRSILHTKKRGSGLARAFARRYRMRSNPVGAVVDTLKQTAPIALSMYGSRAVCNMVKKHSGSIPGFSALGVHAGPVTAGLLLIAGTFVTKKGRLAKMRREILVGMGLNFIDTALTTYAPASVKAYIGLGDEDVYDQALAEYVAVGEYVQMGDDAYAEMGDYIEIGAEEELGMMEELGVEEELGGTADQLQIGTGIGQRAGAGMLKQIPGRSFTAPVPSRSFVKQIPQVGAGYDAMSNLYTGIFKGGF